MDAGMPLEDATEASDAPQPLMAASPANTLSKPASHQNLAQKMQVFLTRTDIQQSRKNRFYLQQVFEHYESHPEEALNIIRQAQAYTRQFLDAASERLLTQHVCQAYFDAVSPLTKH